MKQIIFSAAITVTTLIAMAQTDVNKRSANYEAANWQTVLLEKPQQILIAAPPSLNQSKTELSVLKQRMQKLDATKRSAITHWNAGAPSFRWNQIAPQLVSYKRPDIIVRMPLAWMNLAIYDATILAWKEKLKYKRKRPQELESSIKPVINGPSTYSYPCEHSVTAAAAATVLAYFYPEKADSILTMAHNAAQSRIDAGVQFPSDVEAGWKLGVQVAKQIIEAAKNDRSTAVSDAKINKDPKKWTGNYAFGVNVPLFKPMIIRSADQFRPLPPPDFETDMNEVKNFKPTLSTNSLAHTWDNRGPEFWVDLAGQKMFEYRISEDAPAAARIYTVLSTAMHDGVIAIMDAKYAYWGTRPDQYDTTFKPLLNTPPFPGYPSGHAAGAAEASAILSYFFPADEKQFQQLAQDCADSRFYGGIHFRTDNEVALQFGKKMGSYIVETWMKK